MTTAPNEPAPSSAPSKQAPSTAPTERDDESRDVFNARVLVTGATGFVGRHIVRELVSRGYTAACLVRDGESFRTQTAELPTDRIEAVGGDLWDAEALARAAEGASAVIHLVGIIQESALRGQTFERVHVDGTRAVVEACKAAGIRRFVHMSALGTRLHATSEYHRTKWEAECLVRDSGLDWTIFRPSIIHGYDGEFMRMMRTMVCDATVRLFGFLPAPFPIVPYFGDGQNLLQPIWVRDVARCLVAALSTPDAIGRACELGGPDAMSWKALYRACRELIPGAKAWKPVIGQPVWVARLMAKTLMKLPILPRELRFNADQVSMSQEDSVCDIEPMQQLFGLEPRGFRELLAEYAPRIE